MQFEQILFTQCKTLVYRCWPMFLQFAHFLQCLTIFTMLKLLTILTIWQFGQFEYLFWQFLSFFTFWTAFAILGNLISYTNRHATWASSFPHLSSHTGIWSKYTLPWNNFKSCGIIWEFFSKLLTPKTMKNIEKG